MIPKNYNICSYLTDEETAFQKGGQEWNGTHLPGAFQKLKVVRGSTNGSRANQIINVRLSQNYYILLKRMSVNLTL